LNSTLSSVADKDGGSLGLFGKYTKISKKTSTAKPHSTGYKQKQVLSVILKSSLRKFYGYNHDLLIVMEYLCHK
jgi:hypothetical protein